MIYLSLALFWLAGFGLLRFLFPGPLRLSVRNALLASLGAGVGLGIASCIYFVCLTLAGPNRIVLATLEGVVMIGLIVLGFAIQRGEVPLDWAPGPLPPRYLTGFFFVAAAGAAITIVYYMLTKTHGEWDAWSIWNLRARLLFRSGDFWKDAFSNAISWSHPDYPLLIPGLVSLCWTLAQSDSVAAPIGVAFLFTLATAGLLVAGLGVLRGKSQAFVAGTLLLGTSAFVVAGGMQYADIPLSFYFLATLILLCLQDRFPADPRFTIVAGLTVGLSAWTKNEGLVFAIAVVVARAFAILRFGNRSGIVRQLASLVGGLAAPLAVVALFKLRYAPTGDLALEKRSDILARLIDPGRWITVLTELVKAAFQFGGFLVPIVLVLILYWYLVRFRVEEQQRISIATVLIAIALMFLGDFAVYLLFSNNVVWRINTSIDRVHLQLWPAGLFAFFLAANVPQLVQTEPAPKTKPAKRAAKPSRHAHETR
jgi:hypothetical protein